MKPVSVSYAKHNLSALLKKVRAGHSISITDRGVPVARLVPAAATKGVPVKVIELAERGVVTLPEREPTADWLKGPLPKLTGKAGMTAVEALLGERRTDR